MREAAERRPKQNHRGESFDVSNEIARLDLDLTSLPIIHKRRSMSFRWFFFFLIRKKCI